MDSQEHDIVDTLRLLITYLEREMCSPPVSPRIHNDLFSFFCGQDQIIVRTPLDQRLDLLSIASSSLDKSSTISVSLAKFTIVFGGEVDSCAVMGEENEEGCTEHTSLRHTG